MTRKSSTIWQLFELEITLLWFVITFVLSLLFLFAGIGLAKTGASLEELILFMLLGNRHLKVSEQLLKSKLLAYVFLLKDMKRDGEAQDASKKLEL